MRKKRIFLFVGLISVFFILSGCAEQIIEGEPKVDLTRKVSKSILEEGISSWAKNPDGTANFTIIFTEDTSFDEAVEIIEEYGGYYRKSTEGIPVTPSDWHNDLVVIIDQNKILNLANEDKIKWIDEVPPEPEIYQK